VRDRKPKAEMWKKTRKTKIIVEHKTYEQILQDAGQDVQLGIGKIYDATSGEVCTALPNFLHCIIDH
jgi:tuftelin-interacting protein 11